MADNLELKNHYLNFEAEQFEYSDDLPIINNTTISYHEFFEEYILKNQACLIKNVAQNWESYNKWSDNLEPNFEYLSEKYGNCLVTKYDCSSKYYNSQETKECLFRDYIIYWREFQTDKTHALWYLKDWHLKNQRPDDHFYEVPVCFKSDWLNEYLCENGKDDYRFVYMGPKGTWTPFHADVFQSFSWSVNICGQKRWILLFPGEEAKLKDKLGNLPYDLLDSCKNLKHYEVIQEPGEAIFVPSGWYHQVWNLKDTISINHNWINGCNLRYIYHALCSNLKDVEKEISDCKEMENFDEQCQLILKSTFGMNTLDFLEFILFIFEKRIRQLNEENNQALFDLRCIKAVFVKIVEDGFHNDKIVIALDTIQNIFLPS